MFKLSITHSLSKIKKSMPWVLRKIIMMVIPQECLIKRRWVMLVKKIILITVLIIFYVSSYAQIQADFPIPNTNLVGSPYFDIDDNNRIHIIWAQALGEDENGESYWVIYYMITDSIGNVIKGERRISSGTATIDPYLTINKDLVACIWTDRISNYISYYNSNIKAKILRNGEDYSEEILVDDGAVDCFRGGSSLIWHNDTTIYAYWGGNGSSSRNISYDVYMNKLLLPLPLRKAFTKDVILNNPYLEIWESSPIVIKNEVTDRYILIWSQDSCSSIWSQDQYFSIAGLVCKNDMTPLSNVTIYKNFGKLPLNTLYKPVLIPRKNGNIIIIWSLDIDTKHTNIYFQEFTEDGSPIGEASQVNEEHINVTSYISAHCNSSGDFVIVWADSSRLMAQRFSAEMTKIGTNFKVASSQTGRWIVYPCVKLKNNKIYILWDNTSTAGTSIWLSIRDFFNPTKTIERHYIIPNKFALHPIYPNPFNAKANIVFDLPEAIENKVIIYDLKGKTVWISPKTRYPAGQHILVWDGVDLYRKPLPSGIYIVTLQNNKYSSTQKVLLLK